MPAVADFNIVLNQNGLPGVYKWDEKTLSEQMSSSAVVPVLDAFRQGVAALFTISDRNKNLDNLISMIMDSPENFKLKNDASAAEVRQALLRELKNDPSLQFILLPEKISEEPGENATKLFPPENGETVKDYWIWYVQCKNVFPGPVWILVKRDGSEPAFHYGYM